MARLEEAHDLAERIAVQGGEAGGWHRHGDEPRQHVHQVQIEIRLEVHVALLIFAHGMARGRTARAARFRQHCCGTQRAQPAQCNEQAAESGADPARRARVLCSLGAQADKEEDDGNRHDDEIEPRPPAAQQHSAKREGAQRKICDIDEQHKACHGVHQRQGAIGDLSRQHR